MCAESSLRPRQRDRRRSRRGSHVRPLVPVARPPRLPSGARRKGAKARPFFCVVWWRFAFHSSGFCKARTSPLNLFCFALPYMVGALRLPSHSRLPPCPGGALAGEAGCGRFLSRAPKTRPIPASLAPPPSPTPPDRARRVRMHYLVAASGASPPLRARPTSRRPVGVSGAFLIPTRGLASCSVAGCSPVRHPWRGRARRPCRVGSPRNQTARLRRAPLHYAPARMPATIESV